MDLKQLRSFVRIVELGSINRAAKHLYIAQPALSQQIRRLEEEFDVQLLQRHARGVLPTDAGKALLWHARSVLDEMDKAKAALKNWKVIPAGTVRLGIAPSVNQALGDDLLTRCQTDLPELTLPVHEELSENLVAGVATGHLDLGLAYLCGDVAGLVTEPLIVERLYFAQRSPVRCRGSTITLRDAASTPLVLLPPPHNVRNFVERAANRQKIALEISHEVGSISSLKEKVLRGETATVVPWNNIRREVGAGSLWAVEISRPAIPRTLHLIYPSNRSPTRTMLALRALIMKVVAHHATAAQSGWSATDFLRLQ